MTMNSIRRLRSRPAREVLLAIGLDSPRPRAETIDGLMPRRIRAERTASARCVLRTALRPGSPLASVWASIRIGTGVFANAAAMRSRGVCAAPSSVGLERAKVMGEARRTAASSVSSLPIAASSSTMLVGGGANEVAGGGADEDAARAGTLVRVAVAVDGIDVRGAPRTSEAPATSEDGSAGEVCGRARTARRAASTRATPQR